MAIGADFRMYLLHQFCSNWVEFFLQYTRKKWILQYEFCDFWEFFFKFSKRRHAVPLRPMWTIMVTAKLDHSTVLVTKFRQSRSTLKGRDTDRQTNSAENNGPSGLQSGQKFTIGWKCCYMVSVSLSEGFLVYICISLSTLWLVFRREKMKSDKFCK